MHGPGPHRPDPTGTTNRAAARRRRSAVVVLLLAGILGACGGDDGTATSTTTTAATATSATGGDDSTSTTAAPAEHEPGEGATLGEEVPDDLAHTDEGHTQLVELALELLIGADELAGQTFADVGFLPPEGPGPCGADPDADEPPDVLVGTTLVDEEGRSITEELRVYPDTDSSAAAFAAHRDALGCGTDGDGTTFVAAVDVAEEVGAGAASEVAVVTEDESGVVITALVADAVLTFRIGTPAATPPGPDPREIAAFGIGKVLAALEAVGPDVGD